MDVHYVDVPDGRWKWAEDYFYATATYIVACSPDRTCQVGMGLFALGEPRGEKVRFSGEVKVVVVGAGALHFRVDDGKGPCKVGFIQDDHSNIKWTWDY